ncbi:hypothetical protein GGQ74_002205 [Desulfobaculum xiamenense]|uniref:N-acetyltransferase domain-containing protein n=1 Tax=Desulfobaculum xiamenense TaxID=995050 RepID=A0A846QPV2_9BACT|nr:hypothetical protein [Desulfobaculum xiamenense]NJB68532.1 hypothetical protein [Desulfobaculum xiamenense]
MRLDIVPFRPEHAAELDLRPLDSLGLTGAVCGGDPLRLGRVYAAGGPAFTGLVDGRPVACAGIVLGAPGVGDGWALTGVEVPHFALSFCRAFSRMLPALMAEWHLVRVQALVLEEHATSRRWLERLGFECEGLLRRFSGGRNYYIYARLSDGLSNVDGGGASGRIHRDAG